MTHEYTIHKLNTELKAVQAHSVSIWLVYCSGCVFCSMYFKMGLLYPGYRLFGCNVALIDAGLTNCQERGMTFTNWYRKPEGPNVSHNLHQLFRMTTEVCTTFALGSIMIS